MSAGFRAVQWNRDKLVYDGVLLAAVALYLFGFIAVDAWLAPPKDDLARIYIAGENLSGHVYLMLAWVRIPQNSTSSDEHVAFEFNQGASACASGGLVKPSFRVLAITPTTVKSPDCGPGAGTIP